MNKSFFEEQSKKAEVPSDLRALFKINAGLQELQKSKQQPEQSEQLPSGTVAQQIQQQGIAALNQPPEAAVTPSPAVQTTPDTPMGDVAMQANVGQQIQAAEQEKMQQQMQQMMQQQMASQQPQQMARGGIAALTANNMRNFQRGGVVGFNGLMGEFVEAPQTEVSSEEKRAADLKKLLAAIGMPFAGGADVLGLPINAVRALAAATTPEWKRKAENSDVSFSPISDALRRFGKGEEAKPPAPTEQEPRISPTEQLRAFELQQQAALAAPQAAPKAPPQMLPQRPPATPRPTPAEGGIASLMPAAPRADFAAFEADKAAALAAAREQILPTAQTVQQRRASREAEAKAAGVDLYGTEAKDRIAAREKEFANLSAARDEANKDRAKQNLITMLVNSGGESSLFAGLAKGTKAYQAAEKLQKAEDLIWGGKKIEFMQNIDNQRELINERNKATLLGDIAAVNQIDEAIRVGKNNISTQVADVYSKSMDRNAQAAISAATNATQVAIQKMRQQDEAANRAAAREGASFAALQSRINQNAQTSSNIIKAMQNDFNTKNELAENLTKAGIKLPGGAAAQKAYDDAKAAHNAAIAAEINRAASENYKLEYYQWVKGGKAAGLPEPTKPPELSQITGDGYNFLGPKKQ